MALVQRTPVPFAYSDPVNEYALELRQAELPWTQIMDSVLGQTTRPLSPAPPGTPPFAIICLHGHGGDGQQFSMGAYANSPGGHATALADAGFVIFGIRGGGASPWGNAKAMQRILDAYNYLVGVLGCAPQVGLMGWSMGGLTCLNFLRQYPELVAAASLWVPALDLDYFNSTSGYVPPDGSTLPADATWTAEISQTSALPYGSYVPHQTVQQAVTIPAAGGAGVTLYLDDVTQFSDPLRADSDLLHYATGPTGVTWFSYAGKDMSNKALLGCVGTGASTITLNVGDTVSTAFFQQKSGYSPQRNPTAWAGKGVPVRFNLASDDATIPPSQADYFLAHVGDSNYALRPGGKVTGGHSGVFNNVPFQETVAFFSGKVGRPTMVGGAPRIQGGLWNDSIHSSPTWADVATGYATWAALAAAGSRWVKV